MTRRAKQGYICCGYMRPLPTGLRQGPRAEKEALLPSVVRPVVRPGAVADLPKARSPMGPRRGPQAETVSLLALLARPVIRAGLFADSPRALGAKPLTPWAIPAGAKKTNQKIKFFPFASLCLCGEDAEATNDPRQGA